MSTNSQDNISLVGSDANDELIGGTGDDYLDGGLGNDNLIGDLGDDYYVVDSVDDTIEENQNEGTDSVESSIHWVLGENLENLILVGTDELNGTGNHLKNILAGNNSANILIGGHGSDVIAGYSGDDILIGGVANELDELFGKDIPLEGIDDLLIGGKGNDTLIGGFGDDILEGEEGNDSYEISQGAGYDTIVDISGNSDRVLLPDFKRDAVSFETNHDDLNLVVLNQTILTIKNGAIKTDGIGIESFEFADITIDKKAALDIPAGVSIVRISENSTTSESNEIVDETAGDEVKYQIKLTAPIFEGESVTIKFSVSDASEAKIVTPSYTFTADNWQEPQVLSVFGVDDLKADGNTAFTIIPEIDTQLTTALEYLGSDDDGVAINTIDVVNLDDLRFDYGFSNHFGEEFDNDTTYTSQADTIQGWNGKDILSGGDSNDVISGGYGNDEISGDKHNDKLYGEHGNDELYGGSESDELYGGEGNDWLDGGLGNDYMEGGAGNDTYIVDRVDDVINDNGLAKDKDIVHVKITAGEYVLGASLENAKITTDKDIDLKGNTKANVLTGGDGNNKINGGSGNDILKGEQGDDILIGGSGADKLNGGEGNDKLNSGGGNDIIDAGDGKDVIKSSAGNDDIKSGAGSDKISAGGGNDVINSGTGSDTIKAGSGKDNVNGGKGNDVVNGNGGNDTLNGGANNDIIIGGKGNNVLIGGAGDDIFQFTSLKDFNKITDFSPSEDMIQFKAKAFDVLGSAGDLNSKFFITGTQATDKNDFLIYNANSGELLYDVDGNGNQDALVIAEIGTNLSLTSENFTLF